MAIPYIYDFEFEYGLATKISANVRRLVANNPGPFTGWGTNVYLIGNDDLVVVDPGPDNDLHFDILCKAIGNRKLTAVFVTHHHMDHSPMARRLAAHFGCKTYGFGAIKAENPQQNKLEAGDDIGFEPDVKMQDGEVWQGDGWQITCVHTPGHTSNHLCYAVQPDNGLICGDHVLGWSTSVIIPPDGKMQDYLHSLRKVRDLEFNELWPGHGAVIPQPKQFLNAYIQHRQQRDQQILEQLQLGQRQIKQIVPVIYQGLDKKLYPAASISVLSHLIRLLEQKEVSCTGQADLDGLWRIE
ncbi:MAG: MBL fold metallo-hydrolase [Robiginitomaculum sp.]|nr:MBL fold metallo-hydrolase [Robiginitomaculum sp.]